MSDARAAFTNDIIHAGNLQDDAALIAQGLSPNNFNTEYNKLQSNNYRILSEVYKDVQALRKLNFTEGEIRQLLGGRRALSKKDLSMVMLGIFNPEDWKGLVTQSKSGLRKSIDQINKELDTNYTVDDFINRNELADIKTKWTQVPLGLSEKDRQKYLNMPYDKKFETILEPAVEEQDRLIEGQYDKEMERLEKMYEKINEPKTQLPASPFIPDVDKTLTASLTPVINQTTGLTANQEALLSPSEKVIAQRSNSGIMGLV
jgi:DNA-binding transcriptional MerR regulator